MKGYMILGIIGTEKDLSILLDVKFRRSQWSVKCRSRVPGHKRHFSILYHVKF